VDIEINESISMICASSEAVMCEYNMHKDANGRIWMIPTQKAAGDNIYCGYDYDTKSEGFGGQWLTFKVTGEDQTIRLQGPWHSNSNALFQATGINVRNQHLTQVTISRGKINNVMKDVIVDFLDDEPKLGLFDRGTKLAQEFVNFVEYPVCCYIKSSGGSSTCWIYPEGTSHKDYVYNEKSGRLENQLEE